MIETGIFSGILKVFLLVLWCLNEDLVPDFQNSKVANRGCSDGGRFSA